MISCHKNAQGCLVMSSWYFTSQHVFYIGNLFALFPRVIIKNTDLDIIEHQHQPTA